MHPTTPSLHALGNRSRPARRPLVAAALVALAASAVLAAAPASSHAAPDLSRTSIKVGVFPAQGYDVQLKAAGLDRTPYKVSYASFSGGGLITQAVAQGTVDLGPGSSAANSLLAASPRAPKFLAVATLKIAPYSQDTIVPKGSPIKTVAQLKGKKVAYIPNTTSQYFLIRQLTSAHLKFSDIKGVPLDPATAGAALLGGRVDAYAGFGPTITGAIKQGARVLADGAPFLRGKLGALAGSENVTPSVLKDPLKSAAIADYVARINAAFAWSRTHSAQWAQIVSKATSQPYATTLATFKASEKDVPSYVGPVDSRAIANEQAIANVFKQVGVVPVRISSAAHYSTKLNRQIAAADATYRKRYAAWYKTPSWAR